jgi:hypothetical protein
MRYSHGANGAGSSSLRRFWYNVLPQIQSVFAVGNDSPIGDEPFRRLAAIPAKPARNGCSGAGDASKARRIQIAIAMMQGSGDRRTGGSGVGGATRGQIAPWQRRSG